jgi:hypothetical protein
MEVLNANAVRNTLMASYTGASVPIHHILTDVGILRGTSKRMASTFWERPDEQLASYDIEVE